MEPQSSIINNLTEREKFLISLGLELMIKVQNGELEASPNAFIITKLGCEVLGDYAPDQKLLDYYSNNNETLSVLGYKKITK